MQFKNLLVIFIGGGAGSLCRFFFSIWLNTMYPVFAIGTFVSNILASMLVGLAAGIIQQQATSNVQWWIQPLLITGFCGGFSTFSTFSNESMQLLKNQHYFWAALYIISSIAFCMLAVYLGGYLSKVKQ